MFFDSLSFIFLFLPFSVMLYYAVPSRFREAALLFLSLLFYLLLEPVNIFVMLLSALTDYLLALLMRLNEGDGTARKAVLAASLIKNLFLIIYAAGANRITGAVPPVGIQIYTVTAIDYMLGLYRREEEYEPSFLRFLLICSFFPRIFMGPVVRWGRLSAKIAAAKPSPGGIGPGMALFCVGLAKKVLIAGPLYEINYGSAAIGEPTVLSVWLLSFSTLFALYYTLSSFCDMARGLGLMLSIRLPRNMLYPMSAGSVAGFMSRFNITVGSFLKRAMPRINIESEYARALVTVILSALMGLWFGLRATYLIWGALMGLMIVIERNAPIFRNTRLPAVISRLLTGAVVLLSFGIFASASVGAAGGHIAAMLGFAPGGAANNEALYILTERYPALIAAALLSVGGFRNLWFRLKRRAPKIHAGITAAACVVLVAASCISMVQ